MMVSVLVVSLASAQTQSYNNFQYVVPATTAAITTSNNSASSNTTLQQEPSATTLFQSTTGQSENLGVVATTTRLETNYGDYGKPPESIFAHVTYPNGGETITLTKGKAISYVNFNYGGPLDKTSGNYKYRLELWRNGKLLGNIIGGLIRLPINPYKDSVHYGGQPGEYFAEDSKGYLEKKVAAPGSGYKFKVVLMEAITPKGEPTYYKELTSDLSDAPFSYAADTSVSPITIFKPIFAKIVSPNGGEEVSLTDKIAYTKFEYGGSFSEEKGGNYKYRLELWRDGKLLGNISNFEYLPVDPYKDSVHYGDTPGKYFAKNDKGIAEQKTARAGSGYQYKATLFEAYTPKGETTKYKELTSDFSDKSFSFTSRALTKFKVRVSAADVAKNVEVHGWDPKKKEEIITQPENVRTEKDLQIYMEATVLDNPYIFDTASDESSVSVSFEEKAKLFWFIPVTMKHTIKVDIKTKEAILKQPWWALFSHSSIDTKAIKHEITSGTERLDNINELSELEQLRLQMAMDRRSKFLSTLSNILKKISETQDTLVQNLK